MNKVVKAITVAGLAAVAVMQANAGILIDQNLTTVMLNDKTNTSSKPVAAYECVTWSIGEGRTTRYAPVEQGATGCPVKAFWEGFR
jgi:hypothetical protein